MHTTSRLAVQPLLRKAPSTPKVHGGEREWQALTRDRPVGAKAGMDELVRLHRPASVSVASHGTRISGVDMSDLIQAATRGLLIAIDRSSLGKSEADVSRHADGAEPDFLRSMFAGASGGIRSRG